MAKDLEEIYWLWNALTGSGSIPLNLILPIQKEMFRGHFFECRDTHLRSLPSATRPSTR